MSDAGIVRSRVDLTAVYGDVASYLRKAQSRALPPPSIFKGGKWPPDYSGVYAWRAQKRGEFAGNPAMVSSAKAYYATRPVEFILHWCSTFDPRNIPRGQPAKVPFILFPKQAELIRFIVACFRGDASGLVEKSRSMGATWIAVGMSVWWWLFTPSASIGWGSATAMKVDRLGDANTIFEKIRMMIRDLPVEFLPKGFNESDHLLFMRVINPENGASIIGEAGDAIGRGARTMIYFKDEAAHYEHPELIDAALSETTRCQIDISSVSGIGTLFHRKREAGIEWRDGKKVDPDKTNVFIMDWSDNPANSQKWYEGRKKKAADEGTTHLFAQEVDRDYAAALQNVAIPQDWVRSAIDAHQKLGLDIKDQTGHFGGLDVADGGIDKNALAHRCGIFLIHVDEWIARDTGVTARKAFAYAKKVQIDEGLIRGGGPAPFELNYDAIGVGAGIKSEGNRLAESFLRGFKLTPWVAGSAPMRPNDRVNETEGQGMTLLGSRDRADQQGPKNKEFFANLKAQAWWWLRRRFELTHRAVQNGEEFDPDDLIVIPSTLPLLRSLMKELSQATMTPSTTSMKLMVDKTPDGMKSPNLADAVVICYAPFRDWRTRTMTFAAPVTLS